MRGKMVCWSNRALLRSEPFRLTPERLTRESRRFPWVCWPDWHRTRIGCPRYSPAGRAGDGEDRGLVHKPMKTGGRKTHPAKLTLASPCDPERIAPCHWNWTGWLQMLHPAIRRIWSGGRIAPLRFALLKLPVYAAEVNAKGMLPLALVLPKYAAELWPEPGS